jgi:hypothetical protein
MALNLAKLQTDILKVCLDMNNIKDDSGNRFMAEGFAKAIFDYISGGQTSTTDSGSAPAGSYSGTGIGTMAISEAGLADAFEATFVAGYANNELADKIAEDDDNASSADDTVTETSTGTVTTPSGATSSFSGPAKGDFAGSKSIISTALKACFASMDSISEGGNEKFAQEFAAAIHAYMTGGSISVELKAPFISGSGSGGIA